jgi:hypothetical protein
MSERPSRRVFLGAAVSAALARPGQSRADGVRYTATVRPSRALVGDRVVAVLRATATEDAASTLTFEDGSLMLELRQLPSDPDPARAVPNGRVVVNGKRLERVVPPRKLQRLRAGQHLERAVDLLVIFPTHILAPGDLAFSFAIEADPRARCAPVHLTIESGPEAVPNLLGLLGDQSHDVRGSAWEVLLRMTAYVAGYVADADAAAREEAAARWRRWWDGVGRTMPWSFTTAGAVLGGAPGARAPRGRAGPAPRGRRSKFLGGVTYERSRLDADGGKAITDALSAWSRDPAGGAGALAARLWVADRLVAYPAETSTIDPGEEAAKALESALVRLAEIAASGAPEPPAAPILIATVARMPDPRFVEAVATLNSRARANPGWSRSLATTSELSEILELARAPAPRD